VVPSRTIAWYIRSSFEFAALKRIPSILAEYSKLRVTKLASCAFGPRSSGHLKAVDFWGESVYRHFPFGLSLEPLQARNVAHSNKLRPTPCLARGGCFSILARPPRFLVPMAAIIPDMVVYGGVPGVPLIARGLPPRDQPFSANTTPLRRQSADAGRRLSQLRDAVENRGEQVPRDRHLGQLERHVLRVPRHLGSDLNELLPQRRH